MFDLSIRAGLLVHGIHYGVLGVGLLGLLFLIGPQIIGRTARPGIRSEHERRIQLLHDQIATGELGTTSAPAVLTTTASPAAATRASSLLLPVAIVSSAAAAGVHAAVCPEHFRERLVFGLFFAGSALAQIIWSLLVAFRPTRILLRAAGVGNLAVVALWAVTRTVGLGPLLPKPEAIGPWDLTCGGWELITAGCALALLRAGDLAGSTPRWGDWDVRARAWTIGSVLALVALSVSGAGA